jgi:hypothetical protein
LLVKTDLADEINLEKGVQFVLATTNLNGEKEATLQGTITISKLRNPTRFCIRGNGQSQTGLR